MRFGANTLQIMRDTLVRLVGNLAGQAPGKPISRYTCTLLFAGLAVSMAPLGGMWAKHAYHRAFPLVSLRDNVWFQGDCVSVFYQMASLDPKGQGRTNRHPIQTLATMPFVLALRKGAGLSKEAAVGCTIVLNSALNSLLFFIVAHGLTKRLLLATAGSLLYLSSAAFMFWAGVPESFVMGATTLLVVVLAAQLTPQVLHKGVRAFLASLVAALSAGITVTNGMAGAWYLFLYHRRRVVTFGAYAHCLLSILWLLQSLFVPGTKFYLMRDSWDQNYVFRKTAGGPLERLKVMAVDSVLMPPVRLDLGHWDGQPYANATIRGASFAEGRLADAIVVVWAVCLVGAFVIVFRKERSSKECVLILGILLSQWFLHFIYGDEIFLYAAHWTPFVILVVVIALRSFRWRNTAAVGLMCLSIAVAVHNKREFDRCISLLEEWHKGPRASLEINSSAQ